MKRYRDLTERQTEVLGEIGAGNALPSAKPILFRALLEKGLIVRTPDRVLGRDALGQVAIPQFGMPIHEHIAWCEWCSEQVQDDELADGCQYCGDTLAELDGDGWCLRCRDSEPSSPENFTSCSNDDQGVAR